MPQSTPDTARRTTKASGNTESRFPPLIRRLAAKDAVGEGRVGEHDRCDDCGADEQEDMAQRRGRGGPEAEAEGHDVWKDCEAEASDAHHEQDERQGKRSGVRAAADRVDQQGCRDEEQDGKKSEGLVMRRPGCFDAAGRVAAAERGWSRRRLCQCCFKLMAGWPIDIRRHGMRKEFAFSRRLRGLSDGVQGAGRPGADRHPSGAVSAADGEPAVNTNGRLSFDVALKAGQAWHRCLIYDLADGAKRIRRRGNAPIFARHRTMPAR